MSNEVIAGIGGAVIGAVLSGVFTWFTARGAQISEMKGDLHKVVTALIELREDFMSRVSAIANPSLRENAEGALVAKKAIYLEEAAILVSQIPKHVLSSEYNILGMEHQYAGNSALAEDNFKSAVRVSRSMFDKVVALRSLAAFYFASGPKRDYDAGRRYFQQAAEMLKNPTDSYLTYVEGYTFEMWGMNELWHGFQGEGLQKLDAARKYYNDMDARDPMRPRAFELLELRLKQFQAGATGPAAGLSTKLAGPASPPPVPQGGP